MNYILITPTKNEEENLPNVIESVVEQTLKPILWVLVNDGSIDRSQEIIDRTKINNSWIHSLSLDVNKRDIGVHYAKVCKIGLDYALRYCEKNNILFEYIGILDADMILDKNYYQKLLIEFIKESNLGIASGGVYYKIGNNIKWEKTIDEHPRGSARIIRKECYDKIGMPITYSPDTVMDIRAKLNGWCIRQFKDIKGIQTRKTNSIDGPWKGGISIGKRMYYLNYHPILVFGTAVFNLTKRPHYQSIAIIYSYVQNFVNRNKKINDIEIRDYFWNRRLKEIFSKKYLILIKRTTEDI